MRGLPEVGEIVDEMYEIKKMLGRGGFGAVFLARHLPMDRDVALKMLVAHGPDPDEMIERFKREVMAIRNLSHPNTVRIFDYRDSDEETLLYYTMEYLRGQTLKDVVRSGGPQSPHRVHHILRQVLKSLAEAHAFGIVHRDLKPANIMLVDLHGETDFVKVLDFGIAKIMEQEDDEDDPLTTAGMLVGTLRYMSPEQIKGHELGPYTDLYSLGLIGLELLVGESVFAGTGRWEILQRQVSPDPIEMPDAVRRSPLGAVFTRALAKEPHERYPSAEAMMRDLDSIPPGALSQAPLLDTSSSGDEAGFQSSSSRLSSSAPSTPTPAPQARADTEVSSRGPIFEEPGSVSQSESMSQSQRIMAHAPAHASQSGQLSQPGGQLSQSGQLPDAPSTSGVTPAPDPTPSSSGAWSVTPEDATPPMGTPTFQQTDAAGATGQTPMPAPNAQGGAKGPNKLIIAGVIGALGLFVVLAAIAFMPSDETEGDAPPTSNPAEVADGATPNPGGADPAAAPTKEGDPAEEQGLTFGEDEALEPPRLITVQVGNLGLDSAEIFDGEDSLGEPPVEIELASGESRKLRIEARDHDPRELTLDDTTPSHVSITLDRAEPEEEEDATPKRDPAPKDPPPRRDRPSKPKKNKGTNDKPKKNDSDWIDLPGSGSKKKPKDSPKKKDTEPEVPIF